MLRLPAAVLLLCVGLVAADGAWAGSAERTEQLSAPLGSGGRLEVDNTIGSIRIEGADTEGVEITAHMKVSDSRSEAEAEEFLEQIEIRVEQTPGAVYVRTRVPGGFLDKIEDDYQIDYEIRVPRHVQIDAELQVGNVRIVDVSGRVVVETHVGEIEVEVGS
ncbi:MAG: hypothetical protein HOH74_23575, partial [Gemmatimonadetes bacterium]|nr:hypothetical protein [Gemmatimonadota bacterium]